MENNHSEACTNAILSNDYADFIVKYSQNIEGINIRFNPMCIQIVNQKFAIAYAPSQGGRILDIQEFGYFSFPKCYGLLDTSSMEESGILKLRRQPYLNLYGRDIIIGFIDTGIDYTHPAFVNADNTSRIIGIWDQNIQDGPKPESLKYGTEYTREDINMALASEDPYRIVPSRDENGHGTFMAGIAAGSVDLENEFTGAAPLSRIAMVKLKPAKQYLRDFFLIAENAVCYQENDIMTGITYLINLALEYEMPLVICLGLGTNYGDHDGSSILDEYLEDLSTIPGIVVALAGGNEANLAHHYQRKNLRQSEVENVEIKVGEKERGFSVELWASAPNLFSVGFSSPSGEFIAKIPARLGQSQTISFLLEDSQIFVDYSIVEPRSGDELILMRFDRPLPGIWTIRVYPETDYGGDFNLWLPQEGFISPDTVFVRPEPDITICDPANGYRSIAAAAYNHKTGGLYIQSSRGFSRSGRVTPDITAPGVEVFGPLPGGGYGRKSGTSVAVAHIAGASAMLLEWGIVRGNENYMGTIEVKKFLIKGAKRDDMIYPNREWGYGTLDVYNTLENLRTTM